MVILAEEKEQSGLGAGIHLLLRRRGFEDTTAIGTVKLFVIGRHVAWCQADAAQMEPLTALVTHDHVFRLV